MVNNKDYGIVANVCSVDKFVRMGSKAWIVGGTGGEGGYRYIWLTRARNGGLVTKWMPTERFNNFRCAWLPEWVKNSYCSAGCFMTDTKEVMQERAIKLNKLAEELRKNITQFYSYKKG